ncbi:hypothetical protein HY468_05695 [Candidatus Roizmanbacteria bacterium]|nr:hypothetical protein [Candidatus Roizmanbacteria bacterium]
MKIGVKCGPEKWETLLENTKPDCLEIWYRLDWKERYNELIDYLQKKQIPFGLHFWAVLKDGYEPNLAYGGAIAEESAELMFQTIDIAQAIGATYVNVHPGSLFLTRLDLDNMRMHVLTDQNVDERQAYESLSLHAKQLHHYADERSILFLIETVPKNVPFHWKDSTGRENAQKSQQISPEIMIKLAKEAIYITNDISHTLASWDDVPAAELFSRLYAVTEQLALQTKLIHLNTTCPPFNGTDSHNGVLEEDFEQSVLPTREQLVKLLRLFKDRDDVWIIPEPEIDKMEKNYWEIRKLIKALNHESIKTKNT